MKQNNIFYTFMKYSSLNVLGMIGLSCYILADTFFVARGLGVNGLTSLNLAIPIYSFIHGLGLMIGMGGSTRYSISKSTHRKNSSSAIFTQALQFTIILSLTLLVIGLFFSNDIARLLGSSDATHTMTNTYLKTILLFSPMFMLNNLFICFVRNDNNPKLSMYAMLIGSFSNVILDYIFIFPLNMGMFGAVLATSIAPMISLMVLSLHFLKKKNSFVYIKSRLNIESIKDICILGISALITEVSSGIVMIIFNSIILSLLGNVGVAAYGILANIALVITSIFTGISQGVQPILSQNYGTSNKNNVRKIYSYGIITALICALITYIIIFTFSKPIVSIFNGEHNVALEGIAISGMHIYFTTFFFTGVNIVTSIYFSSIDNPKLSFIISILRGFILIIPITLLLASFLGINGVWLSLPITEFIVSLIILYMFYSLHHKNK